MSGKTTIRKFKPGDRVKRADAERSAVPAYKSMRGTVKRGAGTVDGFDWTHVVVSWDMDDGGTSSYLPEDLELAEDE